MALNLLRDLHHVTRVRNAHGLPRDVRDRIVTGVEWRVRLSHYIRLQYNTTTAPQPHHNHLAHHIRHSPPPSVQVPMGRSKTSVLQLAGFYMCYPRPSRTQKS